MLIRRRLLVTVLGFTCAILSGNAWGDDAPFPRPTPEAIAKAEAKVRDIYKGDLAKAIKPSEKMTLAAELLKASDGVGRDDASRFVLLTMTRDLAIDANDASLAMKAVAALVARFKPDGPSESKEQIERGNAPWKEAETAPAEKRLRLQVEAAEWYLRAKPTATGLDETLIEKRLAELYSAKIAPQTVKQVMPTGWVRIVNRKTGRGVGFGGKGAAQIEPVSDYYKIRQESGEYLALNDWALKGQARNTPGALCNARDANDRSMFWSFEPVGDGYWRIINRESGQCLVPRGANDYHVVQARPHDGAIEQQFRLEEVKGK